MHASQAFKVFCVLEKTRLIQLYEQALAEDPAEGKGNPLQ